MSFSPNSRFLYVSHFTHIYQYDTWSSNIDSSRILVAKWDSFYDPVFNFPSYFFCRQLVADNKIYISIWGSSLYFHVINNPDSLGTACNVQQHSFILPFYNLNIPNFPNYNLGVEFGSPCDTITSIMEKIPPKKLQIKLYPNPASLIVHLQFDLPENSAILFSDITGRIIYQLKLASKSGEFDLDTRNYVNGSYFYQVINKNQIIASGKLVIIH